MLRFRPRQRGAAALLLLMVMGLAAATLVMGVFSPYGQDLRRQLRTQLQLQQAREALIGFAATHGRLPRPAVSARDGRESPIPCQSAASCTGLLPWVTLSVDGADSWSRRLRYSVTPEFTERPLHRESAVADKVVLSRDSRGSFYYAMGGPDCSVQTPCAAAVIFSNGSGGLGVGANGIVQANGDSSNANVDELYNNTAINNFITRPQSADTSLRGGAFDNIVSWLPVPPLYKAMKAAGSLD